LKELSDYFVAAAGLQRLPNRAGREPLPTGQEYAARCSGAEAEGIFPIFVALRRPPEQLTLDQSLFSTLKKRLGVQAHREIKSVLRLSHQFLFRLRGIYFVVICGPSTKCGHTRLGGRARSSRWRDARRDCRQTPPGRLAGQPLSLLQFLAA
jgi:hypothetical protein